MYSGIDEKKSFQHLSSFPDGKSFPFTWLQKKEYCEAYEAEHGEQSVENFDIFSYISYDVHVPKEIVSSCKPSAHRLTHLHYTLIQDIFYSITNVKNIKTAYVVLLDTINHETMLQIKKK